MDGRFGPNFEKRLQGTTDDQIGPNFKKGMQGSTDRQFGPNFERGIAGIHGNEEIYGRPNRSEF